MSYLSHLFKFGPLLLFVAAGFLSTNFQGSDCTLEAAGPPIVWLCVDHYKVPFLAAFSDRALDQGLQFVAVAWFLLVVGYDFGRWHDRIQKRLLHSVGALETILGHTQPDPSQETEP